MRLFKRIIIIMSEFFLLRKIENKNFSGEQFDQGMIRAVWHIARVVIYSPMY